MLCPDLSPPLCYISPARPICPYPHRPYATSRRVLHLSVPARAKPVSAHERDRHHALCALAHRATSISAAPAPRSSTGSTPAPRAARCCSASRTPTRRARPRARSSPFSTGLRWLELDWDGEPVYQLARARASPRGGRAAARRRQGLSLLCEPRKSSPPCASGRAPKAARPAMTAPGATAT